MRTTNEIIKEQKELIEMMKNVDDAIMMDLILERYSELDKEFTIAIKKEYNII